MSTRQTSRSAEAFLANVRESGLLSDDQLAEATPKLPISDRGRVVARALVDLGLLTKFQAERILIGRTVGFQLGQYRILDQLGRGGMGRVFKAQHRTMNRVVALKVLAPTVMQSGRGSSRACSCGEVQATAATQSPQHCRRLRRQRSRRPLLPCNGVRGRAEPGTARCAEPGPLPVSQVCDYVRQAGGSGLQVPARACAAWSTATSSRRTSSCNAVDSTASRPTW